MDFFFLQFYYPFHYRSSIIYELADLPIIVALLIAGNTIIRTAFISICAAAEPAKFVDAEQVRKLLLPVMRWFLFY
jgi:hypothetical protein